MSGRIRTIKPEMLEDAVAASLSHGGFRLFVGLILLVDDWANVSAEPWQLYGRIFHSSPLEGGPQEIEKLLQAELTKQKPDGRVGLIELYTVRGQRYLTLTGWFKHQRIDRISQTRTPTPLEATEKLARRRFAERLIEAKLQSHPQLILPKEARDTLASLTRGRSDTGAKAKRAPRARVATTRDTPAPGCGSGIRDQGDRIKEVDRESAEREVAPPRSQGPSDEPPRGGGKRTTRRGARNRAALDSVLARAREAGSEDETNLRAIGEPLVALAETLRGDLGEDAIESYFAQLRSFDAEAIERAFATAQRDCKFFPAPAELRELAREHSVQREKEAAKEDLSLTASPMPVGLHEMIDPETPLGRTLQIRRSVARCARARGRRATIHAVRRGQLPLFDVDFFLSSEKGSSAPMPPLPNRDQFITTYRAHHEVPIEHVERLFDGLAAGDPTARANLAFWAAKYMSTEVA